MDEEMIKKMYEEHSKQPLRSFDKMKRDVEALGGAIEAENEWKKMEIFPRDTPISEMKEPEDGSPLTVELKASVYINDCNLLADFTQRINLALTDFPGRWEMLSLSIQAHPVYDSQHGNE